MVNSRTPPTHGLRQSFLWSPCGSVCLEETSVQRAITFHFISLVRLEFPPLREREKQMRSFLDSQKFATSHRAALLALIDLSMVKKEYFWHGLGPWVGMATLLAGQQATVAARAVDLAKHGKKLYFSSVWTPSGWFTDTHIDGNGTSQTLAHVEGEKLWLVWPVTEKNLAWWGINHPSPLHGREPLTPSALDNLEGLQARLGLDFAKTLVRNPAFGDIKASVLIEDILKQEQFWVKAMGEDSDAAEYFAQWKEETADILAHVIFWISPKSPKMTPHPRLDSYFSFSWWQPEPVTPLFHEAKTQSELNKLIQGAKVPSLPRSYSQSLNDVVKTMLVQNPGTRPSAAKLLKHERIRFTTEQETFLMRKSNLEERELAFQDAIRNKDAEIYSLCQREMELIQALNKLKEDKDAEIQSLNWKIHHYQRREAEMYEIIQSKQKETKDAFLRRETELLEALEQRDEVMRFTRGRLEALVKCSRSAELEDYKTARSLLEEVTDILYPEAASPMREVVLTPTGEVLRTPSPRRAGTLAGNERKVKTGTIEIAPKSLHLPQLRTSTAREAFPGDTPTTVQSQTSSFSWNGTGNTQSRTRCHRNPQPRAFRQR
ncbi:hypothetical protein B0H14DRAFT_3130276 [Mycena olivaceomarginata]|nr:hypothetical protein B0H14DRAFT_3130276 [Mycena olivaceomarginata]